MAFQTEEQREQQIQAELALYPPTTEDFSYGAGFIGGHQSVGSWFTSGITGLILSKGANEDEQRKWYVQRNGIQFGKQVLEDRIKAYEDVGKYRKLTKEELADYAEHQRRDSLLQRDLEYVFNNERGNLDAPIDSKGQSLSERWGVNSEDEQGLLELMKVLKDNPAYTGGVFTAEILKDLPLSVLAWLGLTAKGASGAAAITKALNKLNSIQPAALRGLAKMGTGVASGAGAGASYEAAYTQLEQGDIKGKNVKAGAAFGAAFGVLAGLGIMARTSKNTPKPKNKASKEDTELTAITEKVIPQKEQVEMKRVVHNINNKKENLHPSIQEGKDYRSVDLGTKEGRATARELGWLEGNKLAGFRGIRTFDGVDGIPYIASDKAKLAKTYRSIKDDVNFKKVTPTESLFLNDFNSWEVFLHAREKTKIDLARKEQEATANGQPPNYKSPQEREEVLDKLAHEEVIRAYNQQAEALKSPSERNVEEVIEEIEATRGAPDAVDVNTTKGYAAKASDFLEGKSKVATGLTIGAGVGAYALSDKEEGDPKTSALVAMLAVGLGPKGYRALSGKSLNAVAMRIKAQVAKGLEVDSNLAKIWELESQRIIEQLNTLDESTVNRIITAIENNTDIAGLTKIITKDYPKGIPLSKIKKDIRILLNQIGDAAVKSGLIKDKNEVMKLQMEGLDDTGNMGAFLNNYFPHLFVNMDKLTDDDLAKIFGRLKNKSTEKRTIRGTLEEIREMMNLPEGHKDKLSSSLELLGAKDAINVYVQGMSRTIIGRNAINSMLNLDLDGGGKAIPAMLSVADLNVLKKGKHFTTQEGLHYKTFDHPALEGFAAHTNIHGVLNDFFAVSLRGGVGDIMEKVLQLNNGLKRVFVLGSLFHAQALFMSGVYSLGLIGAIKHLDYRKLALGSAELKSNVNHGISRGLQVGQTIKQELVVAGVKELDRLAAKTGAAGRYAGIAMNKVDHVTWKFLHDRFKVATWMLQKDKLLKHVNRKDFDSEEAFQDAIIRAEEKAAEFANDAFGSLDWNKFTTQLYEYAAANPTKIRGKTAHKLAQLLPVNKRRWLNLGLFAPDWTISNIRIIAKTFTGLPNASKAKLKHWQKGNWESQEAKEMVKAWNMYAAYSLRAGVYTSALWWAMTEAFSEEEPTMENFWDFWTGENSGKLDLGDGESMVISKQIAEPIHWLQHPTHTFMNKTSVVPKTAIEAIMNKQWFSLKQGMPLGPRLVDEDGTQHYAKWLLGKGIPIVAKPLIDDDLHWTERVERVITGFFGFPQYGDPEK
jgi:hypothetical protein